MALCRKCHKPINSKFLFCYRCNKSAKTYKDSRGYVRFKDDDEPLHRYVAEKKLGRDLESGEVVHHKNRRKADNRFSNLLVFKNQKAHDRIHKKDARRYGKRVSYQGFDSDFD